MPTPWHIPTLDDWREILPSDIKSVGDSKSFTTTFSGVGAVELCRELKVFNGKYVAMRWTKLRTSSLNGLMIEAVAVPSNTDIATFDWKPDASGFAKVDGVMSVQLGCHGCQINGVETDYDNKGYCWVGTDGTYLEFQIKSGQSYITLKKTSDLNFKCYTKGITPRSY